MGLMFWKDNKKVDAFANAVAEDLYSHIRPDVAKEYFQGVAQKNKKKQRKVEQRLAGIIGQMVLQTIRRAGCGLLIVADLDEDRLAKAAKHGADHVLNSGNVDVVEEVKKLTDGKMVDIVFEAVGAEVTVRAGIACLRKGGAMTIIGNLAPNISFPLQEVVTRELKIQGSCASSGEYPACLEFLERGLIDVSDAISSIEPLERGQEMFDRLYSKEPGLNKIILQPGD